MKAIKIHPSDVVAVAIDTIKAQECFDIDGATYIAKAEIPAGHKIAIAPIQAGENIIKYGFPIGHAKVDISVGEHVHSHNVKSNLGDLLEYTYEPNGEDLPKEESRTFRGFRRKDGKVGIRNEVWIIPTVGCVNSIVREIEAESQQFLRENINLIDEYNWTKLYATARATFAWAEKVGQMTDFLLDCGCELFEGEYRLEELPTGFLAHTSRNEFIIPEHITKIGFCAFANSQIQSITIPKNVEEIIRLAFSNCEKLTEVRIETTKLPIRATVSAFTDCTHIENVYFAGTQSEWKNMYPAIELRCGTTVYCSNGVLYYDYMGEVLTV